MDMAFILSLWACSAPPEKCAQIKCPLTMTQVDTFMTEEKRRYVACEDLQQPGGAIALVSDSGHTEWFSKGCELYGSAPTGNEYALATPNMVELLKI